MKIAVLVPTLSNHNHAATKLLKSLFAAKTEVDIDVYLWINNVVKQDEGNKLKNVLTHRFRIPAQNIFFTSRNCGYTGSLNKLFNLACHAKSYDWYLAMNDDITLDPDFFRRFQKETVGFDGWSAGIRNNSGNPESYGLVYQKSGLAFPAKKPTQTKSGRLLCGACLALSAKTVKKLTDCYGYVFHPLFFAYAEDVELSLRLKKLGLGYKISDSLLVTHRGSLTLGRGSEEQLYLGFRNLIMTAMIHWKLSDFIFRLPWVMGGLGYITALSVYKGYFVLPFKIVGAVFKRLPLIIRYRRNTL